MIQSQTCECVSEQVSASAVAANQLSSPAASYFNILVHPHTRCWVERSDVQKEVHDVKGDTAVYTV
jgi:hypothetical protein